MTDLPLKRRNDLSPLTAGLLGAGGAFLITFMQVSRFVTDHPGAPSARWIEAVPIGALCLVMLLALLRSRRMDELERKIQGDALAFAFLCCFPLISLCVVFTRAGFFELPEGWAAQAMVVSWIVGMLLSLGKYR